MAKKLPSGLRGQCLHCGNETTFAWVDTKDPTADVIHFCIACMNSAEIGNYATPAYERVGQKTYKPLIPKSEQ